MTEAGRLQRGKCISQAFCDLDILRLDRRSGRIVELWNDVQVVPDHPANRNGLF